jgi:hypothetical protein
MVNIEKILEKQEIAMPLYKPFNEYKCAIIVVNNMLVEIIETSLSEEKIWNDEKILECGILYKK